MKNYLINTQWLSKACQYGPLLCLSLLSSVAYSAQDPQLSIHPEKCVSLQQGQICYVNAELEWSTRAPGNYCLYASNSEEPLQCWTQSRTGRVEAEFSSDKNLHFYLKQEQKTLTQVELKMSWVYKRKRSSVSWRVF